jgi:hypothetical protein
MDVHEVTWKEKLTQAEHKVARHERIRERKNLQHKRAIDRQQGDADALRVELTHAKTQLGALEHLTKKAERNLDVVMRDRDRQEKDQCDRLARHVGKSQVSWLTCASNVLHWPLKYLPWIVLGRAKLPNWKLATWSVF